VLFVPILTPVGHSVRISISEFGRVESLDGWEEIFAGVAQTTRDFLKLTDEKALRSLQVYFALLPENAWVRAPSWELTYPLGFGEQLILFRPRAVLTSLDESRVSWTFGTNVSAEGWPLQQPTDSESAEDNPRWSVDSATVRGGSLFGTTEVSRSDGFLTHQRVEMVFELEQDFGGAPVHTTAVESVELRREE
jgi:hypothetical protein